MKTIEYEGKVIAKSDKTIFLEGNYYFPISSVKMDYLEKSNLRTECAWKGSAHYFHLLLDGEFLENAAWHYPEAKEKAKSIRDHIAFYLQHGVELKEADH